MRAFAAGLIAAHRTRQPFDPVPAEAPVSATEAYGVQDIVARELWTQAGIAIRAWKTGSPDPRTTPIAAPIPQSKLFASPVTLAGEDFHVIGIEAELAYTLSRDLSPRGAAYTEADVAAAVGSVHAAIEVCDSRLRDWKAADPLAKLADNQMNGALVVAPGVRDWQRIVAERQAALLEVDGTPCAQAVGAHPWGDPLRLLPWLANHCAARCGGLREGDVITTGTWTGMHFVAAPAQVVARFPGIGEVRIAFG